MLFESMIIVILQLCNNKLGIVFDDNVVCDIVCLYVCLFVLSICLYVYLYVGSVISPPVSFV